jgi:phospholipid-translocating ATPase
MIPIFNLGYLYAYALPLFAFVLFYLCKEGWDDYKRYITDRITNTRVYERLQIGRNPLNDQKYTI